MATLATFHPWMQETIEAGHLSLRQAWVMEWEILTLADQPWTPEGAKVKQILDLYHMEFPPHQLPN